MESQQSTGIPHLVKVKAALKFIIASKRIFEVSFPDHLESFYIF